MALALLKLVVPTSSLYTSTRLPSQSCASSQSAASINHDRALRTVRCISLSQTCDQTIVRRTANYKPPIWDYDSLQSLNSKYVGDIYVKGAEKLKEEVKRMLAEVVDPLGGLEMIDDLQRLGVFYHFEDEIKRVLDNIRNDDKWNNEDLHSTALQFRLLRQHGYNIPQVRLRAEREVGSGSEGFGEEEREEKGLGVRRRFVQQKLEYEITMGFELSINTWSMFVNGAVHWVAFDPAKEHGFGILIVAFDMGNEVFREISLPNYQPDGRLHTSTAVAVLDCTNGFPERIRRFLIVSGTSLGTSTSLYVRILRDFFHCMKLHIS
ncbi:unnamed protein product [Camellia sinensis]